MNKNNKFIVMDYDNKIRQQHIRYECLTNEVDRLFLIDGDTILLELLNHPHIDINNYCQTLSHIYLLENRLQYLKNGSAHFHLVFFDNLSIIWKDHAKMQLIREVFIQHTNVMMSQHNVRVHRVKDIYCDEWKQLLDDEMPHFIMLNHGIMNDKIDNINKDEVYENYQKLRKNVLKQLSVVTYNEVQLIEKWLYGFHEETNDKNNENDVENIEEKLQDVSVSVPSDEYLNGLNDLSLNWQVIISTIRWMKDDSNKVSDREIMLFILLRLIMDYLPIKYWRTLKNYNLNNDNNINMDIIDEFCKKSAVILRYLVHNNNNKNNINNNNDSTVLLFDSMILNQLNNLIEQNSYIDALNSFGLSNDIILRTKEMWKLITNNDISESKNNIEFNFNSTNNQLNIEEQKIMNFNGKLVDIVKDISMNLSTFDGPERMFPDQPSIEKFDEDDDEEEQKKKYNVGDTYVITVNRMKRDSKIERVEQLRNGSFRLRISYTIMKKTFHKTILKKESVKRNRQRYLKFMLEYAESLKVNKKGQLDLMYFATDDDNKSDDDDNDKKKKKKKKKKKLSKKEEMIKANLAKKTDEELADLKGRIENLENDMRVKDAITTLNDHIQTIINHPIARVGLLKLLQWSLELYRKDDSQKMRKLVFKYVYQTYIRFFNLLDKDEKKMLASALKEIRFKKGSKSLEKQKPNEKMLQYQLYEMAHELIRDTRSTEDQRVKEFFPDAWQKDLLDAVDASSSVLVVAPTSSGKTMVAFYAMQTLLDKNQSVKNRSDIKRLAFVSPTKALANQVAAEVYAKFGDVSGVYTPDYRSNHEHAQILITVPESLETIYLSADMQDWCSQLNYVIFDEVHEVSTNMVIERMLTIVDCPIIALSATVGDPTALHKWLCHVRSSQDSNNDHDKNKKKKKKKDKKSDKKRKNEQVVLIQSDARWADLEHFVFGGESNTLEYVGPQQLLVSHNNEYKFPETLRFTAKDCLNLYISMHNALLTLQEEIEESGDDDDDNNNSNNKNNKEQKSDNDELMNAMKRLDDLNMTQHFEPMILRSHIQPYAKLLKDELMFWSKSKLLNKAAQDICLPLNSFIGQNWTPLPMIRALDKEDMLPCIIFVLDPVDCNRYARALLQALLKEEAVAVKNKPRMERRTTKELHQQLKTLERQAKKLKNPTEDMERQIQRIKEQLMDIDDPQVDPRFTFATPDAWATNSYWVKRMEKKGWSHGNNIMVKALERGIGVHHNAMPRHYKAAVEAMFRRSSIKIVFATNTLAMGVNVPCRTCVFPDDNMNLDPQLFRQMRGRAGRRGFDIKGNVVFGNIAPKRIAHLMGTRLAPITGHFTFNCLYILKVAELLTHTTDNEHATILQRLKKLFNCSLADNVTNSLNNVKLKHFFRLSLEILYKMDLIDKNCNIVGMATVVNELSTHESAILILVKLVQAGLLDQVCENYDTKPDECAENLIILLCHLFERVPLPSNVTQKQFVNSSSVGILPPTLPEIQQLIDNYDQELLDTIKNYINVLNETNDTTLPISGINMNTFDENNICKDKKNSFVNCLQNNIPENNVIASFGNTTNKEITKWTDYLMELPSNCAIPVERFPFHTQYESNGRKMRYNACAYDFYKNGHYPSILNINNLSDDVAWKTLNEFNNIIPKVRDVLTHAELIKPTTIDCFTHIAEAFSINFGKIDKIQL